MEEKERRGKMRYDVWVEMYFFMYNTGWGTRTVYWLWEVWVGLWGSWLVTGLERLRAVYG